MPSPQAAKKAPKPSRQTKMAVATAAAEPVEVSERLRKGRTLTERRAERFGALLDAALSLFASKGYASTTIEEICRSAFVSTRNFYEEFSNREALLLALYDRTASQLFATVTDVEVEPGPDQVERLTFARLAAFIHLCTDDSRIARVMLIECVGVSPSVEARRRKGIRTLADYISEQARIYASEQMIPEREDFSLISIGMAGAINEILADWALRDDPAEVEGMIMSIYRMFVAFTSLTATSEPTPDQIDEIEPLQAIDAIGAVE